MNQINKSDLPSIGMAHAKTEHMRSSMSFAMRTHKKFSDMGLTVLTETTLTDDQNDLVPDITVYDEYRNHYPMIIIESTVPKYVYRNKAKCIKMLKRFPLATVYVYDFVQDIVYVYDKHTQKWISSKQRLILCAYLNTPIRPLLKPITIKKIFNPEEPRITDDCDDTIGSVENKVGVVKFGAVEGIEPKLDNIVC